MAYTALAASSILVGAAGTGTAIVFGSGVRRSVEPPYCSLRSDFGFDSSIDYNTSGYTSFGQKYKWYMVGQARHNRRWWTRSLERLKQDVEASEDFKRAEYGWWFAGDTALNRICKTFYVKYVHEVMPETPRDPKEKRTFTEEDIWKYCSFLHRKPSSIADSEDFGSGTMGADAETKKKLISTEDPDNGKFWEVRHHEFLEELGSPMMFDDKEKQSFFASLFEHREGEAIQTIRDKCAEAYKKTAASAKSKDSPTKEETLKYCSLS